MKNYCIQIKVSFNSRLEEASMEYKNMNIKKIGVFYGAPSPDAGCLLMICHGIRVLIDNL